MENGIHMMEEELEHLQKRAEAEQGMLRGAVVFAVLVAVVVLLLYFNHMTWRKLASNKVSEDDSVSIAIAKFRKSISSSAEVLTILDSLRRKIHKSPDAALEAARGSLAYHVLQCIQGVSPDDEKVPAVINILNELWAQPCVRKYEHQSNGVEFIECVDTMLRSYKEICENALNQDEDEEAEDTSFLLSRRKIRFSDYEYKFIMAIGMATIDSTKMQSRVGDKGGVEYILESLERNPDNMKIVKWSCWSLVYLCINHPPNKRTLVTRGGIPLIINGLQQFASEEEVNYQGFAVLFSLLSDDPQTKVSLSECRQMALASGIIDLLQNCQKTFRKNKGLQGLTASILDILVTEYS